MDQTLCRWSWNLQNLSHISLHTRYNTLCINYQICLGNANNKIMVCWQNLQELSLYVLQIIFNEIDAKLHQFNQNVSTNCLFDCTCFLCNSQIHLFVVHKMIFFFLSCLKKKEQHFFKSRKIEKNTGTFKVHKYHQTQFCLLKEKYLCINLKSNHL